VACAVLVAVASPTAVPAAHAQVTPFPSTPSGAPNPGLEADCGDLKVMLVLDESRSIHNEGATAVVREAANTFVTALSDTHTYMSVAAFSGTARTGVSYREITQTNVSDFTRWINNAPGVTAGFNPGPGGSEGSTNWQDGFLEVTRVGAAFDLVVYVTDGDPNRYNIPPGRGNGGPGNVFNQTALDRAVEASNGLKQAGSHVFVVGVGPAGQQGSDSERRLASISGTRRFPDLHAQFGTADYTLATNFSDLEDSLTRIVAALCGGSLVVTKYERAANGAAWREAPGWDFTATLEGPPHRWLRPEVSTAPSQSVTTGPAPHGTAEFEWTLTGARPGDATLGVEEGSKRGWRLAYHACRVRVRQSNGDVTVTQTQRGTTGPVAEGLDVPPTGWVTCRVFNRQRVAHLRVVKRLEPSDDPGRFDLFVERSNDLPADPVPRRAAVGDGGRTRRLVLPLGRYSVWEGAAEGTTLADYSVNTRCVNRTTGREVAGVGTAEDPVAVRLRRETDNVVCTITNRGPEPAPTPTPTPTPPVPTPTPEPPTPTPTPVPAPRPPEGETPPPPCLEIEGDTPVCGDVASAPQLVVTKRMPVRARVGDRVPITITVRNAGPRTAEGVRLHETAPTGGRIARVAQGGTIRTARSAVWSLGNLSSGASRTVGATMIVRRTGLLANVAVAAADNAQPDFDASTLRARAALRPPSVTG
jgi:uncharacterized repeat protein (TIGR01451 family)